MPRYLTETVKTKNYYHFMRWLQNSYPDMYVKYWNRISIPKFSEKVNLAGSILDPADLQRLVQIEYDYYSEGAQ